MKTSSFACLAALMLTAGSAFAQANCNCQGQGQFIGYQSCDPGFGGHCSTGNCRGNFWTRPLFPNSCCATKAYPDAGWAPPARLPVNYDWAWYGSYHPQAYYGNPGGGFIGNYPVVYQPNDTAQLGYYYHKVPTWQSRPGMIPPTPNPADFHARVRPGAAGCNTFHGAHGCQTCQGQGQVVMAQQAFNVPNGQQMVRPAGKQGMLGGFRLTSLTNLFN